MPDGLIPPGYRAELIGSAMTLEGIESYAPMEESVPEGSLMLMRIDFADFLSSKKLAELEKALRDKGVPAWPGYPYIIYADATTPSVYLAWQKGAVWTSIIIGILVLLALPLIGSLIWRLMPTAIKDMISMVIGMGMMMLMLWLVTRLIKPLTAQPPRRPRELEEHRR